MEEKPENTCDLCKISYTSELELNDHVWSLMHHIKIEQRKKGSAHTCSLCLANCENIIEYGKHLNDDRHKTAITRRDQDTSDILDSFGQADNFGRETFDDTKQYEREVEFRQPDPVSNRKHWEKTHWQRESRGGHSRSFSEPQIDTSFNDSGNRYFDGKTKGWKNKQRQKYNKAFGGTHTPEFGYQDESFASWNNFGDGMEPNYWNNPHGNGHWNQNQWGQPGNFSQFAGQGLYTAFDMNAENMQGWDQYNANYDRNNRRNFRHTNSNRRGSFDSSFERHSKGVTESDRRGRKMTRGYRGRGGNIGDLGRPESNDKSSPDSNSSSDSGGLKRRRDDDLDAAAGKLRKGNSNKRIAEVVRPLTPGSDYVPDTIENLIEDKSNQRSLHYRERSSSRDRMAESLPIRMETSQSKQPLLRSPTRSLDRRQKQVTWASDMVSSTTDVDSEPQLDKRKSRNTVQSKRSSSLDSGGKRNKLPDSTSDKKTTSNKDTGKHKGKGRVSGSSPAIQRSPRKLKDDGDSVLERAEKLCKKLRDEREKGKKDKEVKEKQKKLEKHKELNSQIKRLTEKNQANIKGHLEAAGNEIDKGFNSSEGTSEHSEILANSKHFGVLEKAAVSLGIPVQLNEELKQSISKRGSKTDAKTKNSQPKLDIDRIRENIENSVQTELSEKTGKSVTATAKSHIPKSDKGSSPPAFPSPLTKHMLSKQKSDSSSNFDTDHLLKMVNAPRSTKEQVQIAQMLRMHAKSQTKLSLPRFNLKMSDICSGSGDRQDELAEFNLENMSPHLQLEIANLIEADIKPDIAELERLLDFQSAGNEMLEMGVLSDLGILSPAKETLHDRSASPHMRVGSPVVTPSTRQTYSTGESALNNFQNENLPSKQSTSKIMHTKAMEGQHLIQPKYSRSASPIRAEVPVKESDNRPSLSIEDLVSDIRGAKENLMNPTRMDSASPTRTKAHTSSFHTSHRETYSKSPIVDSGRLSRSLNVTIPTSSVSANVKVKQEKMDLGYERSTEMIPVKVEKSATDFEPFVRENRFSSSKTEIHAPSHGLSNRAASPTRQSIFSSSDTNKKLDKNVSDMPVKDSEQHSPEISLPECDKRTALEKVKSILDEAPNMERVLGYQQEGGEQLQSTSVAGMQSSDLASREKDKNLDVSHSSQTSSVLDQVYNISLQEESVRQELSVVDQKILQLQKLIEEATQQMNKFTDKKDTLLKQEDQMRSTRMKLLQDSRSQSSLGSQHETLPHSALSHLTDAQLHNFNNPLFIKFLMSQRNPSDLSSVGGFSNVETGSQMEGEQNGSRNGSRRGSFTSNITEPVSITADMTPRQENTTRSSDDGKLLTQSVELLSGSAASIRTLCSENIDNLGDQNTETGTKDKDPVLTSTDNTKRLSQNSFSFINTPLEKSGFVTLDELMSGNSDIGKLLQRSLESDYKLPSCEIENSGIGLSAKDSSPTKVINDVNTGRTRVERERRDSMMSAGSDDILMSGSDMEKRSGKVSMKYMGTIPDGVNYTDFMKQLASDGKTKPVMYTVVTSPDAVSQLKKLSDSGLGTGSVSSQSVPQSSIGEKLTSEAKEVGYRSEGSLKSNTTGTLTINDADFESQSVKSTYSLGEQIKRMCEGQNPETDNQKQLSPRLVSNEDRILEDMSKTGASVSNSRVNDGAQSPSRRMLQSEIHRHDTDKSSKMQTTGVTHDLPPNDLSPTRKKLKTKKERDRTSRRKQKEEFILESSSDTNSVDDEPLSLYLQMGLKQPSLPEEDLVATGSEDQNKGVTVDQSNQKVKRSLLDEVQLETETPSDSCEDRNKGQSLESQQRLKVKPQVLESFRSNVKTKLQGGKPSNQSTTSVQYKGPSLSVSAIQVFKEDVYVCYNGSELRRFNFKTGEILKELDCSPYLVQCLLVTSVEEREDVLFTGGACKKLMLFKPQKFNLIETYDYDERLTCLHDNWGRLFVGLSDGVVSVRSLKTDKELNLFQTTNKSVQCLSSTSAGMTKMLCCGCADNLIYVLDAISGLLLTMLQGHKVAPLCIEIFDDFVVSGAADKTVLVHNVMSIFDDFVVSGAADKTVLVHNVMSGSQESSLKGHKAMVSQITSDKDSIYTAGYDKLIRCYSKKDFQLQRVYYGAGKGMLTSVTHHDGKILTGNKAGLVESIPLWTSSSSWTCQWSLYTGFTVLRTTDNSTCFAQSHEVLDICDGCKLEFPVRDHLLHHVLTDHLLPNSRMLQCPWSGCSQWLSTVDGSQKAEEHIMTEHFK